MTRRDRWLVTLCAVAILVVATPEVLACGPFINFRAYLSQTFWKPSGRNAADLIAASLPPDASVHRPYAGMTPNGGSPSLQDARDAYRTLFPDDRASDDPFAFALHWPDATIAHVREVVGAATAGNDAEAQELELLRCKVDLRAAKPDDKPALGAVGACFDRYLQQPRPEVLASEARGWRARVNVLQGEDARAAKFYLDELRSAATNIRRERLIDSLRLIWIYRDQLDQYFDTAAHALFAADHVTTSDNLAPLRPALIEGLLKHQDLFGAGAESDALALTLMRASLLEAAPDAVLRYAGRVGPTSKVRNGAEFNWLVGASNVLQKRFDTAVPSFEKVLAVARADEPEAALAADGLVGSYAALGRPLDQLHAAFRLEAIINSREATTDGLSLDSAYLLDVQLSDADLEAYLVRYRSLPPFAGATGVLRSELDVVRYALAVRHARHEEYAAAAEIYAQLHATRAVRMREAADLFAATKAPAASGEQRLAALYAYASFLADHEDGIFFNNTLWSGFQTYVFVYSDPDAETPDRARTFGAPPEQMAAMAARERGFRDDQEEDWRAYQILDGVVKEAGHTALGRKAATRAIVALREISDRFGRTAEIKAADLRLSRWLASKSDPR